MKKGPIRDWFDSLLFAVIAATLIRWATFEAFTIPTPSMENSLLVGDFLFAKGLLLSIENLLLCIWFCKLLSTCFLLNFIVSFLY